MEHHIHKNINTLAKSSFSDTAIQLLLFPNFMYFACYSAPLRTDNTAYNILLLAYQYVTVIDRPELQPLQCHWDVKARLFIRYTALRKHRHFRLIVRTMNIYTRRCGKNAVWHCVGSYYNKKFFYLRSEELQTIIVRFYLDINFVVDLWISLFTL